MVFNPSKCVHIEVGKNVPYFTLCMSSLTIPHASCFKYLGVFVQSYFNWNIHFSTIVCKANEALGIIRKTLFDAGPKTKLIAFNAVF